MSKFVEISCNNHILTIQFARPEKKNALTGDMYAAIADAIIDAETNDDVRVVLFKGTQGCFTAGNDVGDFLQNPPTDSDSPVFRFIIALARATVPIIAAVDGVAVGIGTTLLLHCDLVLVTDTTKLQMPFVNLGLLPEAGSTYLLPRLMGHAQAAEIVMLGEPFSGQKAIDLGIATRLVSADALEDEANRVAQAMAERPPEAMRLTKMLLKRDRDKVEAAMIEEAGHFTERLMSTEAREAFSAFLEKRKPKFQ